MDNIRRPVYPPGQNSTDDQVCRVYGGVRGHWGEIADYPWRDAPTVLDYIVIPAMAIVDLGLTAVGDTFTLPYTIGVEVWRATHPNGKTSESFPVVEGETVLTMPSANPVESSEPTGR
ncbi:MAG TPA: YceK/YidQ family lipoprotein [Gemmata sp.]